MKFWISQLLINMNSDHFEKYVLLTGGAGFMGSHCLEYLVTHYPNYHFTCLDKLNYASDQSTIYLSKVIKYSNFNFVEMDISTNYSVLYKLLVTDYPKNKISTIINLAAESSVDRSFLNPLYFTTNNIIGTQNLLECFRLLKDKFPEVRNRICFIQVSTDEVYGEQNEDESVDESSEPNPTNPYSASKAACDLIIKSYQYSYNIPVSIIRSNNVYGPRQYHEKIIPMTLAKLQKFVKENSRDGVMAEKIQIHGDGSNRRAYLHIFDFIKGLDLVWKIFREEQQQRDDYKGQIFNIGSDHEISNLSLVKLICDYYLEKKLSLSNLQYSNYIEFVEDRKYNDSRYSIDYSRIRKLGWKPKISLRDGIKDLICQES